jgi:glycosyltransferase involved in cell wall biosynthesis
VYPRHYDLCEQRLAAWRAIDRRALGVKDVIAWGAYDESKPRVRLLLGELQRRGALSTQINIPVWTRVRDKAVASRGKILTLLLRLVASYPVALVRLLQEPPRGAVLLGYPGIPDIFVVWPIARLRRHKIIFDAFIPLHDTLVSDRRLLRTNSFAARLAWSAEWLALRLADIVIVDTDQHADFFAREFRIERDRFQTVLVGAEPAFWAARGASQNSVQRSNDRQPTVLFYGQLIPLHGIDAILDAIARTRGEPFRWLLIGTGQEEAKVRRFLDEYPGDNVSWVPWVDYEQLPTIIAAADVALGIFGTSHKAARVIPNKVFQILAVGTPIITRESAAMGELARRFPKAIMTVPAGDGAALASAAREAIDAKRHPVPCEAQAELGPSTGIQALLAGLKPEQSGLLWRSKRANSRSR